MSYARRRAALSTFLLLVLLNCLQAFIFTPFAKATTATSPPCAPTGSSGKVCLYSLPPIYDDAAHTWRGVGCANLAHLYNVVDELFTSATNISIYIQIDPQPRPVISLRQIATQIEGASLVVLCTHGMAAQPDAVQGAPTFGYCDNWVAAEDEKADLVSHYLTDYSHLTPTQKLQSPDGNWYLTSYAYGLRDLGTIATLLGNKTNPGGFFLGSWCYSGNVSSAFQTGAGFAGYDISEHSDEACANAEELVIRLCALRPYIYPDYSTSVEGPLLGLLSLPNLRLSSYSDPQGMLCGAKARWGVAALFADHGFSAGGAYCRTLDEVGSKSIQLRGYADPSAWPGAPEVIATLPPHGQVGATADYWVPSVPSFWRYDWAETDSSGNVTTTPLFAYGESVGAPSPVLDTSGSTPYGGAGASTAGPAAPPFAPTSPSAAPYDQNCADIVLYARTEAMGNAVLSNMVLDFSRRGLRARVVLGLDNTVQSFRNAVLGQVNFNVAYNTLRANSPQLELPRDYPVRPEVYIVGDVHGAEPSVLVDTFRFDWPEDPGNYDRTVVSDLLMYDLDSDGRPDGPVSRIPAANATEASRAAAFAHQWNYQQYIVSVRRSLGVVGDLYSTNIPYIYNASPADSFLTMLADAGVAKGSVLATSQYSNKTMRERFPVLNGAIEAGASEVLMYGGYSLAGHLPGQMWPCDQPPTPWDRDRRFLVWAPGCFTHDLYRLSANNTSPPDFCNAQSTLRAWSVNSAIGLGCAGSVGTMNADWQHNHQTVLRLLREARSAAANRTVPISLARLVFDVVSTNMDDYPTLKRSLLGLSAWGGFVEVPLQAAPTLVLTGGSPLCQGQSQTFGAATTRLTSPISYSWRTSTYCTAGPACAGRTWTVIGTGQSVTLTRDDPYTVRVRVSDGMQRIVESDMDVYVQHCDGGGDPPPDDPGELSHALVMTGANPIVAGGALQFLLHSRKAGALRIDLFDVSGRRIASRNPERMAAGTRTLSWNPGIVPAGTYFVRATCDGAILIHRQLVILE